MKPCWCKTITNLLLCINFHSNDCLWSSYEGPVIGAPAKQMRPINHLLWMNSVGICRHCTFYKFGKERDCMQGTQEYLLQSEISVLLWIMWIKVPFITFGVTLRRSRRHFYSKDRYIFHIIVLLFIIKARNLSYPLPQSQILPLSFLFRSRLLVTQTYKLSQFWFFFSHFVCFSSRQVLLIHLS